MRVTIWQQNKGFDVDGMQNIERYLLLRVPRLNKHFPQPRISKQRRQGQCCSNYFWC